MSRVSTPLQGYTHPHLDEYHHGGLAWGDAEFEVEFFHVDADGFTTDPQRLGNRCRGGVHAQVGRHLDLALSQGRRPRRRGRDGPVRFGWPCAWTWSSLGKGARVRATPSMATPAQRMLLRPIESHESIPPNALSRFPRPYRFVGLTVSIRDRERTARWDMVGMQWGGTGRKSVGFEQGGQAGITFLQASKRFPSAHLSGNFEHLLRRVFQRPSIPIPDPPSRTLGGITRGPRVKMPCIPKSLAAVPDGRRCTEGEHPQQPTPICRSNSLRPPPSPSALPRVDPGGARDTVALRPRRKPGNHGSAGVPKDVSFIPKFDGPYRFEMHWPWVPEVHPLDPSR